MEAGNPGVLIATADPDVAAPSPEELTIKLDGKVALVTGASRGIGAAVARGFTYEGAAVAVN